MAMSRQRKVSIVIFTLLLLFVLVRVVDSPSTTQGILFVIGPILPCAIWWIFSGANSRFLHTAHEPSTKENHKISLVLSSKERLVLIMSFAVLAGTVALISETLNSGDYYYAILPALGGTIFAMFLLKRRPQIWFMIFLTIAFVLLWNDGPALCRWLEDSSIRARINGADLAGEVVELLEHSKSFDKTVLFSLQTQASLTRQIQKFREELAFFEIHLILSKSRLGSIEALSRSSKTVSDKSREVSNIITRVNDALDDASQRIEAFVQQNQTWSVSQKEIFLSHFRPAFDNEADFVRHEFNDTLNLYKSADTFLSWLLLNYGHFTESDTGELRFASAELRNAYKQRFEEMHLKASALRASVEALHEYQAQKNEEFMKNIKATF